MKIDPEKKLVRKSSVKLDVKRKKVHVYNSRGEKIT